MPGNIVLGLCQKVTKPWQVQGVGGNLWHLRNCFHLSKGLSNLPSSCRGGYLWDLWEAPTAPAGRVAGLLVPLPATAVQLVFFLTQCLRVLV